MGKYEFLANFDSDEMIFPGPGYDHMTMPQLLQYLDSNYTGKPNSYIFRRIYFPDAEDRNTKT